MKRLLSLHGLYFLAFLIIAGRLFFLQVVNHHYYAAKSKEQYLVTRPIAAMRASVYDRFGTPLAVSTPTDLVIADDHQITNPAKEARAMSGLVGVPVKALTKMLGDNQGYQVVTSSLTLAQGAVVARSNFHGIIVRTGSQRTYPSGDLAESLLGRVNSTGSGTTGLEYEYQSLLAGMPGAEREFLGPTGLVLPGTYPQVVSSATPGVGVELTLDSTLQFYLEQVLANQLHAVGGITAQAVVMDVKTGQILADASLVNTKTNPGKLGPVPAWGRTVGAPGIEQTINNLPFTQAYEPGSVFKAVTFSAALAAGTITPNTPFTVPGAVTVGTRVFHDAEAHGLEHLTATQILALSSNIGTYEVGKTIGENQILAAVEHLGFGQLTAVNYPGETAGLLVNAANWYNADQVALPIGQVDAVPAIQVLDAYNAIANNGVFVEPTLVRGYVEPNGKIKPAAPSNSREALTPAVAQTMNKMLQKVVLAGTGTNAIIPGYQVAGKTGTATIPEPGADRLLTGQYNASFVGFAPANNPTLSMIVVVERPQTAIFGGTVAAPVFQRVMSYALHKYNIPSNGVMVKPLAGAASQASDIT